MSTDDTELLHRLSQTSDRLQCSLRTTRKLIDANELEVVHMGRAVRVVVASENAYIERMRKREAERREAKAKALTTHPPS